MTPVYQTIFNGVNGNCLQAVMASLFNLPLKEVPHFVIEKDWLGAMQRFYLKHGYKFNRYEALYNPNYQKLKDKEETLIGNINLEDQESVNGYFNATVYSPHYFTGDLDNNTHAVVIDKHCNIIHDPVPDYKGVVYPLADLLGSNGVICVDKITKI